MREAFRERVMKDFEVEDRPEEDAFDEESVDRKTKGEA